MFRNISLAVVAIGLACSGGCDWPWEKKIEPTSETRARFAASVDELVKLRDQSKVDGQAAQAAIHARSEDGFQRHLASLKQNLERQIELMNAAEETASTKDMRKKIVSERERTQYDLDQLSEYEKLWRDQAEMNKWRAIDWR